MIRTRHRYWHVLAARLALVAMVVQVAALALHRPALGPALAAESGSLAGGLVLSYCTPSGVKTVALDPQGAVPQKGPPAKDPSEQSKAAASCPVCLAFAGLSLAPVEALQLGSRTKFTSQLAPAEEQWAAKRFVDTLRIRGPPVATG